MLSQGRSIWLRLTDYMIIKLGNLLGATALSITTLSVMTFSIAILSIITFSMAILSIISLSIIIKTNKCDFQPNGTQQNDIQHNGKALVC